MSGKRCHAVCLVEDTLVEGQSVVANHTRADWAINASESAGATRSLFDFRLHNPLRGVQDAGWLALYGAP